MNRCTKNSPPRETGARHVNVNYRNFSHAYFDTLYMIPFLLYSVRCIYSFDNKIGLITLNTFKRGWIISPTIGPEIITNVTKGWFLILAQIVVVYTLHVIANYTYECIKHVRIRIGNFYNEYVCWVINTSYDNCPQNLWPRIIMQSNVKCIRC